MRTAARRSGFALACGAVLLLAACGGGGSGGGGDDNDSANTLVLVDVSVAGLDGIPLNEIVRFEFSEVLDPDTVRPDTVQIREGPGFGKQVPGTFRIDGDLVEFYPRLPLSADLSDAGFQPGRPYRITMPGSPAVATVRSYMNEHLKETTVREFQTALVSSPNLFIDNFLDPLPPTLRAVNPPDQATDVPADSKLMLTFNRRPLHPSTVNTSNIRLYMEERLGETLNRPLPIIPTLIQSHDSVQVEIVPKFPLADQATYRIEVDRRVQDLVGNDVVSPGGGGMFVSRFSVRDEPFRTSALVLTFNEQEKHDLQDEQVSTASWNENVADAIAALFTVAGGNGTAGDLTPKANITLTPEVFKRGVEVQVMHGIEYDVYNFRSIDIPDNVTVRFNQRVGGPNRPVMVLSLKNINIAGTVTVSGGHGASSSEGSNYTTSALPMEKGGKGGPGGGNALDTDNTNKTDPPPLYHGESVPFGGGGGESGGAGTYYYSYYSSSTYYYMYWLTYTPGGGGGGGSREPGTNGQDGNYPSTGYYGLGGKGGKSTVQRGYGLNLERTPNVGGGGGGSGMKGFYNYMYYYNGNPSPSTQYWGSPGAGGGGGGGIAFQSAGDVHVASTAKLTADGGNGGNGMSFYAYSGSSAGGGAGGSVKLTATGRVILDPGATISVRGGTGGVYTGTYTSYFPGQGGSGGQGYIRLEALEDENSPGKPLITGTTTANLSYGPPSLGTFAPQGGGAPSIAQTLWMNLGVYDPQMFKQDAVDTVATLFNDSMTVEVQMAVEDSSNFGFPDLSGLDILDQDGDGQTDDSKDLSKTSDWVPLSQVQSLNGRHYQYIRVRVTFQLDPTQQASHPLPYLDLLRIRFGF